ncbi:NAD(P)-dependent dehydrogenase, short-chain alcohol dehydrogenase family [Klenkia soli]|uniref:NAD(P)-dependent dehydrogenase, short-chain alcohol dehydrogenase family n=1 Tax=Klenkia soli TaxID=1052260 RepID=A0A1H0G1U3_9ACTN|nr:SDR family oxidoreductase [Klenkia soli]SDO00888.1 NAD(P)-dependent dehydrogenase, short-chain alcohol dehydrogenase family [Klenkia soli]
MDLQLSGRTAYVTGAAGGIGSAVVRSLAAEGVHVFAVDVDAGALAAIDSEGSGSVQVHEADLSSAEGCRNAAAAGTAHFQGAPDILVNNAGVGHMAPFEEIDDEEFVATFELNFFAVVRTCRELLPGMRAATGGGSVVTISSDLARQPEDLFVHYAASKAALSNFTTAMARSYAPQIRVNEVCPGPVWTPMWSRPGGFVDTLTATHGLSGEDAVRAFVSERGIPMGRLGTPAEVAAAVTFLASPVSSFTTGASLGVDGGTVRSM